MMMKMQTFQNTSEKAQAFKPSREEVLKRSRELNERQARAMASSPKPTDEEMLYQLRKK